MVSTATAKAETGAPLDRFRRPTSGASAAGELLAGTRCFQADRPHLRTAFGDDIPTRKMTRAQIEELRWARESPPESGIRLTHDDVAIDVADFVCDEDESYEIDEVDDRAARDPLVALIESTDALAVLATKRR
jgi:hypothetical protein